MNEKITAAHLERKAIVYVRQSTTQQVLHHGESGRRQYGLVDHARSLGFKQVEIIDDDLGRSGSGLQERPGFTRLINEVGQSQVGAVVAMEVSRLARNCRDWHTLLELCRMSNTLVIDHDGVYDPVEVNDQLVLGLKGTISEFELSLFRVRAQEAYFAKACRGELVTSVPVGYVKTIAGRIEITPDRQVQDAIRGVFAKMFELGSARQVAVWYVHEQICLPHQPRGSQSVAWRIPTCMRIVEILRNPCYAGAYAFGRKTTQTIVEKGRARKRRGLRVKRNDWKVLIPNHHEGYITWDQYEQIEKMIDSNTTRHGSSPAREGRALLSGLLRCRRCGRKLSPSGGSHGSYECRDTNRDPSGPRCVRLGARRIDAAVVKVVLDVIRPEAVAASLEAAQLAERQEDEKARALNLALEKARYEAGLARRQYDAVDPANRLVAGELETRWNKSLQVVEELQQRLAQHDGKRARLSSRERERLMELGRDVEQLWHHRSASMSLKKRIVRTLIEEIMIEIAPDTPQEVLLTIHWKGGAHTELRVVKNRVGENENRQPPKAIAWTRELSKVCTDEKTAFWLNRLRCTTGTGLKWTAGRVRVLRNRHGIEVFNAENRQWLTLEETAAKLELSAPTIRKLLRQGIIQGAQITQHAPWVIENSCLDKPEVLSAVTAMRQKHREELQNSFFDLEAK